jgi:hypothetical protein
MYKLKYQLLPFGRKNVKRGKRKKEDNVKEKEGIQKVKKKIKLKG